jgi:hypothetical protein
VDFAENGSVIGNLPEEGNQRAHALILSLYSTLSADTVATELPLLLGTTPCRHLKMVLLLKRFHILLANPAPRHTPPPEQSQSGPCGPC